MALKKLVRDNIPMLIQNNGQESKTRILGDEEYLKELKKKLREEAEEVYLAADTLELMEELADVLEVADALRKQAGISHEELEYCRRTKAEKNGRFEKRVFLESVSEKSKKT